MSLSEDIYKRSPLRGLQKSLIHFVYSPSRHGGPGKRGGRAIKFEAREWKKRVTSRGIEESWEGGTKKEDKAH